MENKEFIRAGQTRSESESGNVRLRAAELSEGKGLSRLEGFQLILCFENWRQDKWTMKRAKCQHEIQDMLPRTPVRLE